MKIPSSMNRLLFLTFANRIPSSLLGVPLCTVLYLTALHYSVLLSLLLFQMTITRPGPWTLRRGAFRGSAQRHSGHGRLHPADQRAAVSVSVGIQTRSLPWLRCRGSSGVRGAGWGLCTLSHQLQFSLYRISRIDNTVIRESTAWQSESPFLRGCFNTVISLSHIWSICYTVW